MDFNSTSIADRAISIALAVAFALNVLQISFHCHLFQTLKAFSAKLRYGEYGGMCLKQWLSYNWASYARWWHGVLWNNNGGWGPTEFDVLLRKWLKRSEFTPPSTVIECNKPRVFDTTITNVRFGPALSPTTRTHRWPRGARHLVRDNHRL